MFARIVSELVSRSIDTVYSESLLMQSRPWEQEIYPGYQSDLASEVCPLKTKDHHGCLLMCVVYEMSERC